MSVADSALERAADALNESLADAEDVAVKMYQGSSAEVEVTDPDRPRQTFFLGFMRVDKDWVFTWRKGVETQRLLDGVSIKSRILAAQAIPSLFLALHHVHKSHLLGVDETVAQLNEFLDAMERARHQANPDAALAEVVERFIQSGRTELKGKPNPPATPSGTT